MVTDAGSGLSRFVAAQQGSYSRALAELRAGRKQSHWMWYIFPQLAGLGRSATARHYAIRDRAEAAAYLAHPLLGERLRACTAATLALPGRSAQAVFGSTDALKFRSCMTLFAAVSERGSLFEQALGQYCDSEPDALTLSLLEGHA